MYDLLFLLTFIIGKKNVCTVESLYNFNIDFVEFFENQNFFTENLDINDVTETNRYANEQYKMFLLKEINELVQTCYKENKYLKITIKNKKRYKTKKYVCKNDWSKFENLKKEFYSNIYVTGNRKLTLALKFIRQYSRKMLIKYKKDIEANVHSADGFELPCTELDLTMNVIVGINSLVYILGHQHLSDAFLYPTKIQLKNDGEMTFEYKNIQCDLQNINLDVYRDINRFVKEKVKKTQIYTITRLHIEEYINNKKEKIIIDRRTKKDIIMIFDLLKKLQSKYNCFYSYIFNFNIKRDSFAVYNITQTDIESAKLLGFMFNKKYETLNIFLAQNVYIETYKPLNMTHFFISLSQNHEAFKSSIYQICFFSIRIHKISCYYVEAAFTAIEYKKMRLYKQSMNDDKLNNSYSIEKNITNAVLNDYKIYLKNLQQEIEKTIVENYEYRPTICIKNLECTDDYYYTIFESGRVFREKIKIKMNKISCLEYEENEIVKLTNDMFNACDKYNEKIQKIKKIICKNLLCISKLLEKNTIDNMNIFIHI